MGTHLTLVFAAVGVHLFDGPSFEQQLQHLLIGGQERPEVDAGHLVALKQTLLHVGAAEDQPQHRQRVHVESLTFGGVVQVVGRGAGVQVVRHAVQVDGRALVRQIRHLVQLIQIGGLFVFHIGHVVVVRAAGVLLIRWLGWWWFLLFDFVHRGVYWVLFGRGTFQDDVHVVLFRVEVVLACFGFDEAGV